MWANQSLQPVQMGASPPPRQPKAQGGVTKNAGLCQMGHVPGRPAGAGLEVCVGEIKK